MFKNEMSKISAHEIVADPSTSWFTSNEHRFQQLRAEIANSNAEPDLGKTQRRIDSLTDQLDRIAAEVASVKASNLLALRTKATILEEYLEEDASDVFHDLVLSICRDLQDLCDNTDVSEKTAMAH